MSEPFHRSRDESKDGHDQRGNHVQGFEADWPGSEGQLNSEGFARACLTACVSNEISTAMRNESSAAILASSRRRNYTLAFVRYRQIRTRL